MVVPGGELICRLRQVRGDRSVMQFLVYLLVDALIYAAGRRWQVLITVVMILVIWVLLLPERQSSAAP